jgi:hypothetical protein
MKTLIGVLLVTELAAFGPGGLGQSVANDAEVLREKAVALYDSPARYPEAAALHVREAQLRGGGPKAADALVRAARLRQYNGKTGEALGLMKWAGTVALDCGDVVQAAHAYLDAAFLAIQIKRVEEGYALARRAQRLADSPLLDVRTREAILRRITGRVTPAS